MLSGAGLVGRLTRKTVSLHHLCLLHGPQRRMALVHTAREPCATFPAGGARWQPLLRSDSTVGELEEHCHPPPLGAHPSPLHQAFLEVAGWSPTPLLWARQGAPGDRVPNHQAQDRQSGAGAGSGGDLSLRPNGGDRASPDRAGG